MKRLFLLLSIVTATFTAEAQEYYRFGKVSKSDFEKTSYPIDVTDADAIVLDELQQTFIYPFDSRLELQEQGVMLTSQTTISRKIKILRPEGVRHATVTLDFYAENTTTPRHTIAYVGDIDACSYSFADGEIKKQPIKEEDIKACWVNDSTARVEFTIPNVAEGSIIEYTYKMDKKSINPYNITFAMQRDIPVMNCRCEVAARMMFPQQAPFGGVYSNNWYAVFTSGQSQIKTANTEGKLRVYAIKDVPTPLRAISDGFNSISSRKKTDVNDMCTFYNYRGKNLPAITATTKPEDIAAVTLILQNN